MSGEEIREKIIELNDSITNEISPAVFVLNEKVSKAQKEIEYLRRICDHKYDDLGYCIYCDKRRV